MGLSLDTGKSQPDIKQPDYKPLMLPLGWDCDHPETGASKKERGNRDSIENKMVRNGFNGTELIGQ